MKENSDALEKALAADLGKPVVEAQTADIGMSRGEAALAIKKLRDWTSPKRVPQPLV